VITAHRNLFWKQAGFTPNPSQAVILDDPHRFELVSGGERAGKSKISASWAVGQMWNNPDARQELGWIVANTYDLSRPEYDYIAQMLASQPGKYLDYVRNSVNPGLIRTVTGGDGKGQQIIRTKSAQDYETLAGEAPDWILVVEAGHISWDAWLRIRGRAAEKRARVFLSGTFEGSIGWYPELWTQWQTASFQEKYDAISYSLASWTNTDIYPGGRQDPEILALEAQVDADTFNERIAGIPAPPKGRVHAEFRMTTHCQHVEFDPTKVIHIWIDPGFSRLTDSAYSVLAAQMHHVGEQPQIRIFDEIYAQETYGEAIIQTLKNRPWWNAAPMKAVIDQGEAQHAAIASQADVWVKEAGLMPFYQPVGLLEGIRRVNSFMKVDPI